MAASKKFILGSNDSSEKIFSYPFLIENESKEFIISHGKIMFIIRGPPGTGKKSLSDLIERHFPDGIVCSADDFFGENFAGSTHTKEELIESHLFCHRRVKEECEKETNPIIVSNTHVKKKEMQEYLDLAMKYQYTVIVISTTDKFEISPEILARSNNKGLGVDYFKKRLQSWQDVFPSLMGWFLCENDSFFVLQQLQFALDALLGDGRFCRVFDAYDSDALRSQYVVKTMLHCVAGFMKNNPYELRDYYESQKVRDAYGKCFRISIQAFVITKSDIFAIVQLNDSLRKLTHRPNFKIHHNAEKTGNLGNVIDKMQSMSIKNSYNFKLIPLNSDFSQKTKNTKSAILEEKTADHLNMCEISFIHVAQKERKPFSAWELNILFRNSFSDIVEDGKIKTDKFNQLENGYAIYRLHNEGWIVNLLKNVNVKTIFTGLYL